GFDGLLVKPGAEEIERLGAAFDRVLSSPGFRRALGRRAAARARERVAPEVVYAQYEDAYASAIEHARHQGTRQRRRTAIDLARLIKRHAVPWTVQQPLLVARASLRAADKETYELPKVRIDALPATQAPPPAGRRNVAQRSGARREFEEAGGP